MEFIELLPFVLAAIIVILIRVMAGTNNLLGKICRWFWNASFKFTSYIPFCGWMANFIIADTEEEKTAKDFYLKVGSDADAFGSDMAASALERERTRQRKEEAIRTQLAARGLTDVAVNADGTFATAKDKHGNSYNVHIVTE